MSVFPDKTGIGAAIRAPPEAFLLPYVCPYLEPLWITMNWALIIQFFEHCSRGWPDRTKSSTLHRRESNEPPRSILHLEDCATRPWFTACRDRGPVLTVCEMATCR